MYKRLFKVLVCFFIADHCAAQSAVTNPNVSLFEHAAGSPNASGLGKFSDYPVNMATGLPSIEIPLYTIKSGNITLPVSLKYHAGGIRVNENAGWVGMGWSLDAGGVINRTINGTDDFFTPYTQTDPPSNYINHDFSAYSSLYASISDALDSLRMGSQHTIELQHFLGRIPQGLLDGESDEYFFSMPGGGGKFFYNQKLNQFQNDKINGWKINWTGLWDIQNNNGIRYGFGKAEQYVNPLLLHNSNPVFDTYLKSAWYLSTIDDRVTNKNVSIYYDEKSDVTFAGFDMSKDYRLDVHSYYSENVQGNVRDGTEVSVSHIDFDQGSIVFIKDTATRLDGGTKALKEIQVKNVANQIVKRYLFTYFYTTADPASNSYVPVYGSQFIPNPNRVLQQLFLQSVQEISTDANGNTVTNPPYTFTYNFDHQLPCRYSFAQDLWGYYNGKKTNATLIPNQPLVDWGINSAGTGANRDIDTSFSKTGIIKELQYPTGGKAVFDFEGNVNDAGTLTGGLRVKKITNYDNVSNTSLVTEYAYAGGHQLFKPVTDYQYTYIPNAQFTGQVDLLRVEGQSIFPLFCSQGSPVLYTDVTQKQKSGTEELISQHHFLDMGKVDDFRGTSGAPHNKYLYYDNFNGQENESEVFRKNPDGSTTLIQKNSTDLQPLNNLQNYFWNVQGAWTMAGTGSWVVWFGNDPYNGGPTQPLNVDPDVNAYKLIQDQAVPKQQQQINYEGAQSLNTQTFLDYDVTNGNNKVVKTLNSEGDTLIKLTKFVSDYTDQGLTGSNAWNTGLSAMMGANIIGSPLEVLSYLKKKNQNNLLLLSGVLFQYDNLTVQKIYKVNTAAPVSNFQESYNNGSGFFYDSRYQLFQEVTAKGYNNNPLTVNQDGKKESYIWDYAASNVIAIIKDADQSDVAYTSFEVDGSGNWAYSGTPAPDATAPTGKNGYLLNGTNNITRSGLSSGKTYIVSYWLKNTNPLNITGTLTGYPVSGKTVNGWTYFEHKVTGQSTITISGGNSIDELRLYPERSLMATNIYEPLIGMNTQCDVTNKITHYEYDALHRLSLVRDQDRNIIKKICYNYAGQPEACPIGTNTTPQWRATGNSRCQPCPANSNYNSGVKEIEEKDINPNSATSGATHWVVDPLQHCPSPADYQPRTDLAYCELVNGVYTGNQVTPTYDVNPCSNSFNLAGPPIIADYAPCHIVTCNPACSEPVYKCINGVCTHGTWAVIKVVGGLTRPTTYTCYWAWCFPDGTWLKDPSLPQTTTSSTACTITCY